MDGEEDYDLKIVMDEVDGFDFLRVQLELVLAMHSFMPSDSMEAFEARAASARRLVHEEIMAARVWFMNLTEGRK